MSLISHSNLRENYTRGGRFSSYSLILEHKGLNEIREIKAGDYQLLMQKRKSLLSSWEKKWERIKAREKALRDKRAGQETAENLTNMAKKKHEELQRILKHTLTINDAVDWESLKNKDPYDQVKPAEPKLIPIFDQPKELDFSPKLGFFDKMFSFLAKKKEKAAVEAFQEALTEWRRRKRKNSEIIESYKQSLMVWEEAKRNYEKEREDYNNKIDNLKMLYLKGDKEAVLENCEIILNNSEYPDEFPRNFNLDYVKETQILIVEYELPNPDQIPTLKEVRFIISKSEFKESYITDAQKNKLYDSVVYQIVLRTIHELFEGDTAMVIKAISLNGMVRLIDKAIGKMTTNCILSIQVQKEQFEEINLELVDPKACFKNLKGVGSSKLHGITPVVPIMKINTDDSRFIEGYSVTGDLDDSSNLATMDWEDFEHLVRELFEQEFRVNGGEVKVTKASKDGGVDAVAFDPDPIRGGKIIIQAKRYTNTVGVSAVRDLYGTVQAEGANKGILVTTADYGPDSYKFAQGKPLTLLNGANLLSLLERHGHKAYIDVRAAKIR